MFKIVTKKDKKIEELTRELELTKALYKPHVYTVKENTIPLEACVEMSEYMPVSVAKELVAKKLTELIAEHGINYDIFDAPNSTMGIKIMRGTVNIVKVR